jgi:thiol-disulfide isomerase/thioredoxin
MAIWVRVPHRALALAALLVACQGSAAPRAKLELVEAPAGADVRALVVAQLAKARLDHRHVVVYVGASWCEPCVRFHKAAERGELDEAFGDVTFVGFDADRDGTALEHARYHSELIPLFAIPSADGTASGRQIEGSIKGDGAVGEIAPRLRALVDP